MMPTARCLMLTFVFLFAAAPAMAESVTIYRDTYGVPHVYADTVAAGIYGLGYAQAEDRLQDIYDNIRVAVGTYAEAYGPEYVDQDYFMRVTRNAERCQEYWQSAPGNQQEICNSFIAGINAFLAEHPEKRAENAFDLEPWHLLAIGRAMILKWPLGNIMDDLKNKHAKPDFGSNGWVVAPSRSAADGAILLADPHLEWEGMQVFFEARVHAGDLHMDGFFLVGAPLVGIGHNGHVAWACTTGGPDTGDVFAMKLNPANLLQYEYDGQWKDAALRMVTIPVKGKDPVSRPVYETLHGPAVSEPDKENGVVYVGATPYFEAMGAFEQSLKMVMAKNATEFYEALSMNQLMDQNIPYADTSGNIGYVRVGLTPIRPEGYDWTAPVPGNTSATAWKGLHPLSDHVQILNPPQGYLQNCNISPANMMVDSPLTPDKFIPYLYNVTWDTQNPRGWRSTQLLQKDDSITKEEAMQIAFDVFDVLSPAWKQALEESMAAQGSAYADDPEFQTAVKNVLIWGGSFVKESTAATVVKFWRLKCNGKVDAEAIRKRNGIKEEDHILLLALLRETLDELKAKYGTTEVPWGDIHVVGRGGVYYPSDGADFGGSVSGPNFTETLFDVRSRELDPGSGKYVASNGSMATFLVFLHPEGAEAYSCTPWGQSADPSSPHYMDQGRDLYSPRKFKPTWFKKDALLEHVALEKVLTVQ